MRKPFTFDCTLTASFTVDAPDRATAEKWLRDALDCASINAGSLPNGQAIVGEASVEGDLDYAGDLDDAEIDEDDARALAELEAETNANWSDR